MARKHHKGPAPGHPDFVPLTDAQRRAHADALATSHEGHDCDLRAENLCQAAEYYAMLDEHQRAEQLFREALDIEEAEPGSVHAFYASFLLDQGRDNQALEVITQARRLNPEDPDVFNVIGDALLAHDYPQQAARWFTAGLVAQLGHLTDLHIDDLRYDFDLGQLAQGRYHARQALGQPLDHIDELAQELRRINTASINTH
jgi:tetratricopeptide (TPR) repeat protein